MKNFLLILLLIVFTNVGCKPIDLEDDSIIKISDSLPVVRLKMNELIQVKEAFSNADSGTEVQQRTMLGLRYDEQYLEIRFECLDNPWVNENYYTKDNTSLFKQEVFELFISNGAQAQEQYLEIEINPNNAVFLAKITNRYKSNGNIQSQLINPTTSGLLHGVEKDSTNEKWSGFLKLPLSMLNYPQSHSTDTFRLNFFRIIAKEKPVNSTWRCSPENAIFACWNSTKSTPPQFHKPESFGFLILK